MSMTKAAPTPPYVSRTVLANWSPSTRSTSSSLTWGSTPRRSPTNARWVAFLGSLLSVGGFESRGGFFSLNVSSKQAFESASYRRLNRNRVKINETALKFLEVIFFSKISSLDILWTCFINKIIQLDWEWIDWISMDGFQTSTIL